MFWAAAEGRWKPGSKESVVRVREKVGLKTLSWWAELVVRIMRAEWAR